MNLPQALICALDALNFPFSTRMSIYAGMGSGDEEPRVKIIRGDHEIQNYHAKLALLGIANSKQNAKTNCAEY